METAGAKVTEFGNYVANWMVETQKSIDRLPPDRRAEVQVITGLSAHAGQHLLLDYAGAVKERVKEIFLVHGEEDAAGVFMGKLKEKGFAHFRYPSPGDTAEL